ncbi:hypothetical protein GCM10023155_50410 [Bremerella cremea]
MSAGICLMQQRRVNFVPQIVVDPALETIVGGLPTAELRRQASPRAAREQDPQNRTNNTPMVGPRPAWPPRKLSRKEIPDCIPLIIREIMMRHLASCI